MDPARLRFKVAYLPTNDAQRRFWDTDVNGYHHFWSLWHYIYHLNQPVSSTGPHRHRWEEDKEEETTTHHAAMETHRPDAGLRTKV
jgi:hypothetical protein